MLEAREADLLGAPGAYPNCPCPTLLAEGFTLK